MKNYVTLLFLALLASAGINAQSTIKAAEMSSVLKRTMLVELLEENPKVIEKLKKKSDSKNEKKSAKYGNWLDEYRENIGFYNEAIQELVANNWTLSDAVVEFKTTTEIAKKINANSSKYAVLSMAKSTADGVISFNKAIVNSGSTRFGANMFVLSRIEDLKTNKKNNDFSRGKGFFTPLVWDGTGELFSKEELIISVRILQAHIKAFQDKGKKLPIHKFIIKEAEKNCEKLGSQNINLSSNFISKKSTFDEIRSNYAGSGKVKEISNDEYKRLLSTEEDIIIGLSIPWRITKSEGAVTVSRIHYIRTFVNLKTLEFYTANGAEMGQLTTSRFRKGEFKKYGLCK